MSDGRSWLQRARDHAMMLAQKYEGVPPSVDLILTVATEAYLEGATDQWTENIKESCDAPESRSERGSRKSN